MESIRYSSKRLAEIVGATPKQVEAALAKKDGFGPRTSRCCAPSCAGAEPFPRRIQLFLNFKGGTGKTSLSSSYAYRLAERGYRVLMVDLDSQGHATKCLGREGSDFTKTLHDVLIRKTPVDDVTVPTGMPNLSLVPANLAMSTIDLALMPLAGREFRLRNALQAVAPKYDFVVMDAPPSFGLLNLNALMAADDLIIPVLADFLSYDGLRLLFETVQGLEEGSLAPAREHLHRRERLQPDVQNRARGARRAPQALRRLPARHGGAPVHQVRAGVERGCPIFGYDADSKGAVDIESVQQEIFARIRAASAASGAAGA